MAFTTKSIDEIIAELKINLINNVSEINDANIGSVLDTFVTSLAQELGIQYEDLTDINNNAKIDTATGTDLEQLGKLVGVIRNPGENAIGTVSFIRNTVSSSEFIIPAGTIVATAPNTSIQQYTFTTDVDTTFVTSIDEEEHTYDNTETNYTFDQKVVSSITEITGILSSSAHTFVKDTDYQLVKDATNGDYIKWLGVDTPDNATVFKVTYVPLSVDIAVTSSNIGLNYNVSKGQIIYKISSISSIDRLFNYVAFTGGLDLELDASLRDRIQNASSLQSRATEDAIIFNILQEFNFVNSVSVNDLPLNSAAQEEFVYHTGTTKYALSQKVAINNTNLVISNSSGGTANYTRDTDYSLTTNNEIEWNIGETTPNNGATFYVVSYDYNKLGNADVLIVGSAGELSPTQVQEVQDYVDGDEIRAIGTVINISQPTYIDITIDANITKTSGFIDSDVTTNINNNLETYFNSLEIGEDILFSKVVSTIINTTGVDNVSVTDINGGGATDYTIAIDEVGSKGAITITYI